MDKRQDKLRRMRKRDTLRLAIVGIFELMAEQRRLLFVTSATTDTQVLNPHTSNNAKQSTVQQQRALAAAAALHDRC